jgi:hypothetical protein
MGKKLNAKDLSDPRVQASFTDAEAHAIKKGMKVCGDKLIDDEISTVVANVRRLKN